MLQNHQIIEQFVAAKEVARLSIERTVTIDGESYTFAARTIMDGFLSMILPESFTEMSQTAIKEVYPSEPSPQMVFRNMRGDMQLAISVVEQPILPSEIKSAARNYRNMVKRLNPANTFYTFDYNFRQSVAFFDYRSYALDGDLYNLVFLSGESVQPIMGNFSCPFWLKKKWSPLFRQMVESLSCKSI